MTSNGAEVEHLVAEETHVAAQREFVGAVMPEQTRTAVEPVAGLTIDLARLAFAARRHVVIAPGGAHDRESLTGLSNETAHEGKLARSATELILFQADHVRGVLEFILADHARVFEELLQRRRRYRLDRIFERRDARMRPDRALAVAQMTAGKNELITRINQVRVLYLRVVLPDLGPQPRLLQEAGGNVPKRVALPDDIAVRMLICPLDGGGKNREGEKQSSRNRK